MVKLIRVPPPPPGGWMISTCCRPPATSKPAGHTPVARKEGEATGSKPEDPDHKQEPKQE
jgi:hypothetical protein